jgi:hypothetical protein
VAVTLIKLHHVSRSADVHSLSRGYFRGREGARLCLIGDMAAGTIDKMRWWRPKTIGAGVGDYGPFKIVGDALATPASPERAAYCMRTCLESYFRRTRGLNLAGDSMFILSKPGRRVTDANGKASWLNDLKFYACSRDTVRNDVDWVMTEAGVPSQYRPHSTRAASGAAIRRGGGTEFDVLRCADVSSKVYRLHYEKPIVAADGSEVTGDLMPAARAVYGRTLQDGGPAPPRKRRRIAGAATASATSPAPPPPAAAITNRRPPGRAPRGMDWDYDEGEWTATALPPPPPPPAISASRSSTATRSGRRSATPGFWWASSSKQADKDNNLHVQEGRAPVLAIEDR